MCIETIFECHDVVVILRGENRQKFTVYSLFFSSLSVWNLEESYGDIHAYIVQHLPSLSSAPHLPSNMRQSTVSNRSGCWCCCSCSGCHNGSHNGTVIISAAILGIVVGLLKRIQVFDRYKWPLVTQWGLQWGWSGFPKDILIYFSCLPYWVTIKHRRSLKYSYGQNTIK